MPSKKLVSLVAAAALLVVVPAAQANHVKPNLGIEVTAVDPLTRTVTGIVHCTTPERAGRPESFKVTPDIEFNQFLPGMTWGIAVDPSGVILSTGDMPCNVSPQGPPPPPGGGGGQPGPGQAEDGPVSQLPTFDRSFLTRVWKFEVEFDSAEAGVLNVTIGKVLNLPKRLKDQDDALVDEAAVVLFDRKTRVYENGRRTRESNFDEVEGNVRVYGKLSPPSKWQKDEDGTPVPTIRARKIYL
jgi:hypothetical protein